MGKRRRPSWRLALRERLFVREPEGRSDLHKHGGGGTSDEGWKSVSLLPSLQIDCKATECVNTFKMHECMKPGGLQVSYSQSARVPVLAVSAAKSLVLR